MQSELSELTLLPTYREQRQHIFPSQSSLDWFIRKHRQGLVQAGALLFLTGRWFTDPSKFDSYLIGLGSRQAGLQARTLNGADEPRPTFDAGPVARPIAGGLP